MLQGVGRCALSRIIWVTGALVLSLISVAAGPVGDFETKSRAAYAEYRVALFQTNAKNAEASRQAILGFEAKWTALTDAHSASPPPHYTDDPTFKTALADVARLNSEAKAAVMAGDLGKAHDILEGIRDILGDLRLRNGIIGFSDRTNVVHAHMEHMLIKNKSVSPQTLPDLREELAVMMYLSNELKQHPAPEANHPEYAPLLQALIDAVAAAQNAARAGDAENAKAALGKIKPAFGRFFLKFG